MIQDQDTNMVFFSKWLFDPVEGHPDFFARLTRLLDDIGIKWGILKYTNDYWVRDFMPVQLAEGEFLKYRYRPDYLLQTEADRATITNCSRACKALGIKYAETNLVIDDGGNIVPCGECVVMTDKVFTENNRQKSDPRFIATLEAALRHKVIVIPWHPVNDDVYGHSDGLVKYCGDNRVLMSNCRQTDEKWADAIRSVLEANGFAVTEMLFDTANPVAALNWAYINFLQVGNVIVMPCFGIAEDTQAQEYVQRAFPSCKIHTIEMAEIAEEGGALHCISWNIKL